MQFAIDENCVRTSINNSIKGKLYKCPCCGTEVIQKKGDIMIWHFAHKSLADCVDYYDHKGEWHRAMQELFPEENREVYERTETYRHIFDVLTDESPVGWKGERNRLYLSDVGYQKALDNQKAGNIKIISHAAVAKGNLYYDHRDMAR